MSRKKISNSLKILSPLGIRIKLFEDRNNLKARDIAKIIGKKDAYINKVKYGRIKNPPMIFGRVLGLISLNGILI